MIRLLVVYACFSNLLTVNSETVKHEGYMKATYSNVTPLFLLGQLIIMFLYIHMDYPGGIIAS